MLISIGNLTWTKKEHLELNEVLNRIKSGYYQERLDKVKIILDKHGKDSEQYRKAKTKLPAIIFQGVFPTERKAKAEDIVPSGFLIADIDNLSKEQVQSLKNLIKTDTKAWFCFESPSGFGLKVGYHSENIQNDNDNKRFFFALEYYFLSVYGIQIDKSCKDISRLCFVSYDKELWVNDNPVHFDIEKWEPAELKKEIFQESTKEKYGAKVLESSCRKIANSAAGNQHYTRLAMSRLVGGFVASGYINESDALSALESAVGDSGAKDIRASMKTVNAGLKYGMQSPLNPIQDEIEPKQTAFKKMPGAFWFETMNNKGESVLNINHSQLLKYIESKGIFNTEFQNEKILVQRVDNILKTVAIDDIRNWLIKKWLPELPFQITENKFRTELEELLTKGINIYVQPAKIEILDRKSINILKDTEKETLFFFKNGIIKVNADNISCQGYNKIKGDIWKKSINDHHIALEYNADSIYEKFLCNISNSEDRYKAICTAQGYLLNRYNNPAYPKAVILSDGIIGDSPNGGTGKGIIAEALSYARNQAKIDGRKLDLNNAFALQKIELQSELVLFDDVEKNFQFDKIFSDITSGYQVRKLYQETFSFTPADNPKTLITTNYAVRGDGHSFERRKAEIELYSYYGQNGKKPEDDFGTLFTWDAAEWNRFYNFIFRCVMMYHQNGNRIAEYQSDTLSLKKTITETGVSFYEFAEDLPLGEWLVSSEYYEKYLSSISKRERDFMSSNKFGRLLTSYCKGRGLILEKKKVNDKKCFKINN